MITVAVAGGTGNVGRTFVDVLKQSPKHNVIVLSRKAPEKQDPEAPVFAVDYNDVESVTKVLESNNVHTLISAVMVISPESGLAEISLVNAAAKAASTKQFVASDWGVPRPKEIPVPQGPVRDATVAALRKTSLQWTRVYNGYFLDYYGLPYLKSYMLPLTYAIDVANKAAAIPGTGNEPMTFTYTVDVARFTVAALDLPQWDSELYCFGESITLNEFLKLAEDVRGSKFTVTYDGVDKLQKGEVSELPSHPAVYPFLPKPMLQGMFSSFGLLIAGGHFKIPEFNSLNRQFPEIKPLKVKDVLEYWRGKEGGSN